MSSSTLRSPHVLFLVTGFVTSLARPSLQIKDTSSPTLQQISTSCLQTRWAKIINLETIVRNQIIPGFCFDAIWPRHGVPGWLGRWWVIKWIKNLICKNSEKLQLKELSMILPNHLKIVNMWIRFVVFKASHHFLDLIFVTICDPQQQIFT